MSTGRMSPEYAQFLCDRFYRLYKQTCKLKVNCIVSGCDQFAVIKANIDDLNYDELKNTFKCSECKVHYYCSTSDED